MFNQVDTSIQYPVTGSNVSFSRAVFNYMDSQAGAAKQLASIKAAFIKKHGHDFNGHAFSTLIAENVANWRSQRRLELVATFGAKKSWKEYERENKAMESAINSINAWLSRNVAYKINFNCEGGRLRVANFIVGRTPPVQRFELVPVQAKEVPEKATGEQAKQGKKKAPNAEKEFSGKELASSLSEKDARSALLNILNQYPELTLDKAIRDNFQRNLEKAEKAKAAQKALTGKAKAA